VTSWLIVANETPTMQLHMAEINTTNALKYLYLTPHDGIKLNNNLNYLSPMSS
jgi:hypothetical protein